MIIEVTLEQKADLVFRKKALYLEYENSTVTIRGMKTLGLSLVSCGMTINPYYVVHRKLHRNDY